MGTNKGKWLVFCKREEDAQEWVYADSQEEALEVIRDNFSGLKPCYATKIEDYSGDYILLKWGTLKGWKLQNPKLKPFIDEYNKVGGLSMSTMTQTDTIRQKEIICDMIDIIGKPVYNDWSGDEMSIEEAKKYVMDYER
jgi:hypothetical protein